MLFSIPVAGWWVILAMCAVFCMVGMRAYTLKVRALQQYHTPRRDPKILLWGVVGVVVQAVGMAPDLRHPLFTWCVYLVMPVVACYPIAARVAAARDEQERNQAPKAKMGVVATIWVLAVLFASIALTQEFSPYNG